jgi:hypothetical protein
MAQYLFGPGQAWGTPVSDASGNAIAVPSPILFAAAQDVSIDMGFETKLLHGTGQFPLAVGRGKGKVSGKIKNAQVNGALWNSIVFGQTLTNGIYSAVYDTSGALIPATPFQITPTVPSSGTWSSDLSVRNAAGFPMTRVASTPAAGQYSVAAGVYTFAAADTGLRVFIDFLYTATSTAGPKRSTVVNVAMGNAPVFRLDLNINYLGKSLMVTLPNCIATKLNLATKLDDFAMPEFDFESFADASGNVLTYGTSE